MKLNRKTLRRMILNEIKIITESQAIAGLPHEYDEKTLYNHVLNFIRNHPNLKTDIRNDPALREKADMLMSIVNNAVRDSVRYREDSIVAGTYDYVPGTSPEELEDMYVNQDMLKLARRALGDAMGSRKHYRTGRGPATSSISDKMRQLAQSGQLKPGMQPSDVPELRKNMPSYQPGGRFYDPDDPIHDM